MDLMVPIRLFPGRKAIRDQRGLRERTVQPLDRLAGQDPLDLPLERLAPLAGQDPLEAQGRLVRQARLVRLVELVHQVLQEPPGPLVRLDRQDRLDRQEPQVPPVLRDQTA